MGTRSPLLDDFGDDFAWSLLEASPNAVVLANANGEVVFVNDMAATLFGYSPEEMVELVVDDLLPERMRAAHRADRTRYAAEPTVRPMGEDLALQGRHRDGTEFPVEISLSPVHLGGELHVLAAVRDITTRVRAQDHLTRVLQTIDATDDGLFIFDADTLRYSFVNEGAVRLVGYERDDLLTMTPLHINPSATEELYRGIVDDLQRHPGRPVVRQTTLLHRSGREIPVEKTYQAAATGSDGSAWVIGVARDVTTRLEAAELLRESQEALQEAERAVAIADDRERIARDLHDTVIQRLFGEGLRLEAVMPRVDEATKARLGSIVEGLDQTIKELRKAIFSLQSTGSRPGGLRGRLLEEVTSASDALGFEPRLQFDGSIESIDDRIAEHLVAVMREALANVARHAHARAVRVAVNVDHDAVSLTISDDGVGSPAEVLGGNGLANMRDRAAAVGGTCSLSVGPDGGTVLHWTAPTA